MTLLAHRNSCLCHIAIYKHRFAFVSLLTVERCKKWWINQEGKRTVEAGTSDVTTCTCGVQPPDGAAATWQTPDEANGCGIVGLRLFNLIPPFDDCMVFFLFFFLKAWEMVQCRVYTEGKVSFYVGATGWTLLQKLLVMILRLSARHPLHLCFLSVRAPPLILQKVKKRTFSETKSAPQQHEGVVERNSSQLSGENIIVSDGGETERWRFFVFFFYCFWSKNVHTEKPSVQVSEWNHTQKTWARPVTAHTLR